MYVKFDCLFTIISKHTLCEIGLVLLNIANVPNPGLCPADMAHWQLTESICDN